MQIPKYTWLTTFLLSLCTINLANAASCSIDTNSGTKFEAELKTKNIKELETCYRKNYCEKITDPIPEDCSIKLGDAYSKALNAQSKKQEPTSTTKDGTVIGTILNNTGG